MAEEGEELKGYYERKLRNLEEALEKALQETERELQTCSRGAAAPELPSV